MMAFICVFVSMFMAILVFKGQTLRKYNLISGSTEDGVYVVAQNGGSVPLKDGEVGEMPHDPA